MRAARLILPMVALVLAGVACDDHLFYPNHDDGSVDTDAGYHPSGWSSPDVHGLAAKLQEQRCTDCHGETLEGGVGLSCDTCHPTGWRTDCTFCHGGDETPDGAPPHDIDGTTDGISFPPHTAHVTKGIGPGFDCAQCHDKPTDVLSSGHLFVDDDTPGQAEVDLSAGLASQASWSGTGCTNNYCHGDGQGHNGTVVLDDAPMDCASCHAGPNSGESAWERMSGEHADHLEEGLDCHDCHGDTTSDDATIADPSLHPDGEPTLALPGAMVRSGDTCDGSCHGENHDDRDWD